MTASAALEALALLPPGLILVLGALVLPFLRGRVQVSLTLLLPLLSFAHLCCSATARARPSRSSAPP